MRAGAIYLMSNEERGRAPCEGGRPCGVRHPSANEHVRIFVAGIVSCLPGSRSSIARGEHLVLIHRSIGRASE